MVTMYLYYLKFSYWKTSVNNCSLPTYNINVKPSGTPKCKKPELNASEFQKKSISHDREFKNYKNKAKILEAEWLFSVAMNKV